MKEDGEASGSIALLSFEILNHIFYQYHRRVKRLPPGTWRGEGEGPTNKKKERGRRGGKGADSEHRRHYLISPVSIHLWTVQGGRMRLILKRRKKEKKKKGETALAERVRGGRDERLKFQRGLINLMYSRS